MADKKIAPCGTTVARYRAGSQWAAAHINKLTKGGAGKKKAKSKKRIAKPPVTGWRGGDPKDNGAK
jgi:hypothetical protein